MVISITLPVAPSLYVHIMWIGINGHSIQINVLNVIIKSRNERTKTNTLKACNIDNKIEIRYIWK